MIQCYMFSYRFLREDRFDSRTKMNDDTYIRKTQNTRTHIKIKNIIDKHLY